MDEASIVASSSARLAPAGVPPLSRRAAGLTEFALAIGGFAIGTGEFAIMGLLPDVAEGLGVSTPEAGHVISAYALGVVVGAPVIALAAAKMAKRQLLLILMAIFALGNLASTFAPSYGSFVVFRFLSGLPHGAYFGVAALVAASMAAPNKRTQAVGRVMLGLTVATLIGTPFATWLGQLAGWRSLFATVGAIAALTVLLVAIFVPQDRVRDGAGAMRELGAFARSQVWFTLGIGAVGFGGMFAVFSYIASTAVAVAGLSESSVPLIMVAFGAGMVLGNIAGAWLADRSLMGTIGGMLVFNVVVLTVFALFASSPVVLFLCVFLIGCGVAVGPALQTRLMDVAGDAQTLAAALNHSAFNVANALGAWLGGAAIAAGYGFASTGWVGAVLGLGGLGIFALSASAERARPAAALREADACA
ncbi:MULTISPECIES: MFS transporter [unclassified Aureimonas]|uniref:MFS transporter n=1 Tax=unclassified Aureimonas TaxID=2615206 RepID=UPI0006F52683|nr:MULTISPECIES: MFS transporter [unclassified Aureimonas]KQT53890.1 MFS transporter [Aureimonas sp. Leaf427]KQT71668.1 MFS transporter [Aureimonas sp. Leaf460]